jgi:hypothetical protein
MMTRSVVIAIALATLLAPAPLLAQAPESQPTPHRMRREPMAPSHRAQLLKKKLETDIAAAKAKGLDVSLAETRKMRGDEALKSEHYWKANEYYGAAEKALERARPKHEHNGGASHPAPGARRTPG